MTPVSVEQVEAEVAERRVAVDGAGREVAEGRVRDGGERDASELPERDRRGARQREVDPQVAEQDVRLARRGSRPSRSRPSRRR